MKPYPFTPSEVERQHPRLMRLLLVGLIIVLAALAGAAYYRLADKGNEHAIDFFSYWRSGQLVWQGIDPYQVALADQVPGIAPVPGEKVPSDWRAMPANTAPLLLLLAPLSRLPWEPASAVWMAINLCLIVLDGALVVRLFNGNLRSWRAPIIMLAFALLIATRETVEYGQTTLFVFASMLLAMLAGEQHRVVGGLWLGLALSKISLAFPAALFFLYKRWFRGLTIGILVQVAGLALIAVIGETNLIAVGLAYIGIFLFHTDLPGYHLTAGLLQNVGSLAVPIVLTGSIGLWAVVAIWYRSRRSIIEPHRSTAAVTLFIIIMQWNLLTFYHRRYDNAVNILFLALVLFWVNGLYSRFNISGAQRYWTNFVAGLCAVVWIAPLYQVLSTATYVALFDLCSLAALVTTMLLLFRIPQRDEAH